SQQLIRHRVTEQSKHQDPPKQLDNNLYLGQLAQFSTVQGIEGMQGAMAAMASVMESDQTLRAAALVGRDAMVAIDSVPLATGAGLQGEVVAASAGPVTLDVVDANGARSRRITVGVAASGSAAVRSDGRGEPGSTGAA